MTEQSGTRRYPSKGVVVDCRGGNAAVVDGAVKAFKGKPALKHALDAVSEGSCQSHRFHASSPSRGIEAQYPRVSRGDGHLQD
jgi:hypothetical protein